MPRAGMEWLKKLFYTLFPHRFPHRYVEEKFVEGLNWGCAYRTGRDITLPKSSIRIDGVYVISSLEFTVTRGGSEKGEVYEVTFSPKPHKIVLNPKVIRRCKDHGVTANVWVSWKTLPFELRALARLAFRYEVAKLKKGGYEFVRE